MKKFEVYGMTEVGHLVHIIKAESKREARKRFQRAHPGSHITAIAIPNGAHDPVFVFGTSSDAKIRTQADVRALAEKRANPPVDECSLAI